MPAGWIRVIAVVATVSSLGACTSAEGDPAARAEALRNNDPYESWNRRVFDFNLKVDDAIGKPLAEAYRRAIPQFGRDRIRNMIDNWNSPVVFMNDVLQGERKRAAETAVRFWFNSTFGIAGLFDAAGQLGLKAHKEDFGQTLAVWGVPEGPYLMLPLLGPSNPRDLVGRGVDSAASPWGYLLPAGFFWVELVVGGLDAVDTRARTGDALDELRRTSLDLYASLRSLYRQNRQSEISNGQVKRIPLPGDPE
jgi:phospholipid-binding lipoprotein MlaA